VSLLILLALGLGVGLTVYEFSPRVHTRVDAYARAIRAAHDAHVAADAHLVNASAASVTAGNHAQVADATRQTPGAPQAVADAHHAAAQAAVDASADHAVAATAANQVAAKHTAEAAKNARTEAERQEVVKSAAQVLARSEKIAQALAHLGVGCPIVRGGLLTDRRSTLGAVARRGHVGRWGQPLGHRDAPVRREAPRGLGSEGPGVEADRLDG